jgi:hypothetical protein
MANRILGRTGSAFWQDESFDHWIRSVEELRYLIEYVKNNPCKAGLVVCPTVIYILSIRTFQRDYFHLLRIAQRRNRAAD